MILKVNPPATSLSNLYQRGGGYSTRRALSGKLLLNESVQMKHTWIVYLELPCTGSVIWHCWLANNECTASWNPILNKYYYQEGGGGHLAIYYTSLQSFLITFLYVGLTTLGTSNEFWLVCSLSCVSKRFNQWM